MAGGYLRDALDALKDVVDDIIQKERIEKAGDTIKACAVFAAIAGVGSGWIPGAGGLIASAAWVAAIWGMYVKVNIDLGISLPDNILKSLASALLTNIIASAGTLLMSFVAATILSFVPFLGSAFALAADGFIGYVTVFASGVLYIRLLTRLFKAKGNFTISSNEVKSMANDLVKEVDMSELIKEGRDSYKQDKKDGKFNK